MELHATTSAYEAGRQFGQMFLPIMIAVMLLLGGAACLFCLIKAFTRRTSGWIIGSVITGLISLLGLLGGIGLLVQKVSHATGSASETAGKKTRMSSKDGGFSIEVPGSWKPMPELNEDAQIAAGNPLLDAYAIVIPNPRSDYEGSFTEFDELVLKVLLAGIERPQVSPPETQDIQGRHARRRRIEGTVEKTRVVYSLVTLETPDTYYQIMAWTTPSKEARVKSELEEVIRSFNASAAARPGEKPAAANPSGGTGDRVRKLTAKLLDVDPTAIKPESSFTKDLGADSLDTVELVMALEEEFGLEIPDDAAANMKTFGDVVRWIDQQLPQ